MFDVHVFMVDLPQSIRYKNNLVLMGVGCCSRVHDNPKTQMVAPVIGPVAVTHG